MQVLGQLRFPFPSIFTSSQVTKTVSDNLKFQKAKLRKGKKTSWNGPNIFYIPWLTKLICFFKKDTFLIFLLNELNINCANINAYCLYFHVSFDSVNLFQESNPGPLTFQAALMNIN